MHLCKLDVEGHELDVLNGAKSLFVRVDTDRLTFEFGGCNINMRTFSQDFWCFLKAYDYSILARLKCIWGWLLIKTKGQRVMIHGILRL
ncbi:FkbM family methyltransferase [Helicobacter mastomyrinus]|uniref:FkbM family methyltransferase n=2 Tax=Helicobacter TaxID=209 RepID=A0ABZ3F7J5_9HELI